MKTIDSLVGEVLRRGTIGKRSGGGEEGRYFTVVSELGHGGMGAVFLARQSNLDKEVALKVLFCDPEDPSLVRKTERFHHEAEVMHSLKLGPDEPHPAIVAAEDFDSDPEHGYLFYSMTPRILSKQDVLSVCSGMGCRFPRDPEEWSNGGMPLTLDDFFSAGEPFAFPQQTVARAAVELTSALAFAHGKNVLHKDVKPSNILLDREGRFLLTDFGISKTIECPDSPEGLGIRTTTGGGTIGYRSPEQVRGVPTRPSSDYYSLAVVLFQMLTGRPFAFDPGVQGSDHWKNPSDYSDRLAPISRRWDVLLRAMMDPDPEARLSDPEVLGTEFSDLERGV